MVGLQGDGREMVNYLTAARLCGRLGSVPGPASDAATITATPTLPSAPPPNPQPPSTPTTSPQASSAVTAQPQGTALAADGAARYAWLRQELASLAATHVAWFYAQHFAQARAARAAHAQGSGGAGGALLERAGRWCAA